MFLKNFRANEYETNADINNMRLVETRNVTQEEDTYEN